MGKALPVQHYELVYQSVVFSLAIGVKTGLWKFYQYNVAGAKKISAYLSTFHIDGTILGIANRFFLFVICMMDCDEY